MKQIIRSIITLVIALMLEIMGIAPAKASNTSDIVENNSPSLTSETLANQLPVITIWYESALRFGVPVNPQNQINILGNVSDPDGTVTSLTYSLNGKPAKSVSLGTSNVRLIRPGDFNINLYNTELAPDTNTLLLTARDNSGAIKTRSVTFTYKPNQTLALPYSTHWSSTGAIQDQAQVIDGLWKMSSSGVAPVYFGYDRLIGIGSVNWSQYEILVPITVRAFYPDPNNPDDAGGVGVISRWNGHFGLTATEQPPTGWSKLGAYAYYSNRLGRLALRMDGSVVYTQSYAFQANTTYLFKLRSETVSGTGRYSFKIWPIGTPEPNWNDTRFAGVVNRTDTVGDPQNGSVLLVAHRADATFGNVTICPLSGVQYPLNVNRSGSGSITYQPGQQSSYACGQGLTITAKPDSGWSFSGWSGSITSKSATISFNMTQAMNLTANFTPQGQAGSKVYLPAVQR